MDRMGKLRRLKIDNGKLFSGITCGRADLKLGREYDTQVILGHLELRTLL